MTAKSRRILMAFVGAYLVYIGVQIVRASIAGTPKYETLLIVLGVVFAAFGILTVLMNVGAYVKARKTEQEKAESEELDVEDAEDLWFEETVADTEVIEEDVE